MMKDGMNSANR